MNVFPSSSTKTLYLRSVRCKARSSSITRRICSWFCAAYAACTTYRLVVMIIWTPLLGAFHFFAPLACWRGVVGMSQEMVHWRRGKESSQESRREKPKMQPEDLQARWKAQGEEIFAAVAQWRAAHPQATLAEIEQAVDEQMNRLRARMIEQAAQASAAAEREASQGLVCEQCGQALQARGRARRRWQTHGGQQVEVERTYVTCPQCGGGFFPPG